MDFAYKIRHKPTGKFLDTQILCLVDDTHYMHNEPDLTILETFENLQVGRWASSNTEILVKAEDFEICQYAVVLHDVVQIEPKEQMLQKEKDPLWTTIYSSQFNKIPMNLKTFNYLKSSGVLNVID